MFVLPAALYTASWALGLRKSSNGDLPDGYASTQGALVARDGPGAVGLPSILLLLALLVHLASLYVAIAPGPNIRLGFSHVLSASLWIGVLLLWLELDDAHARAMRSMVLPIAALTTLLPMVFPGRELAEIAGRSLLVPHLLVGILAYSVLFLALLHAVLMASAERQLRAAPVKAVGPFARFIDRLPPLLSMERMLFRLVGFGFGLLTLTAVSGMFYSEQIFGQPFSLDHKTVFTLLAWAVFGVLLLGRWLWGWRGRTALRLTVVGFIVLLLGYVGSRFVLEAVLGRV